MGQQKEKTNFLNRVLSVFTAGMFIFSSITPVGYAQGTSQTAGTVLNLPAVGVMVPATGVFHPPMIKGVTVHPENPLEFDFIVDPGEKSLQKSVFEKEAKKMIKYFLAALTVPEEEMWVNLSPYEADRVIPESFGDTEMGRDMLAQDNF